MTDETPTDPFAGAKANLRDTVKWLTTAFAGLAALVLAGASLTGIAQLQGIERIAALAGGAIGLLCLIVAAGIMLRLLSATTFFVSDLAAPNNADLKWFLNNHAIDFLPAQLPTVDVLLEKRLQATQDVRNNPPQSQTYQGAATFLEELNPTLSRLTNLAQLEVLRRDLNSAVPWLFLLALGALVGLGVFATYSTPPKQSNACQNQANSCPKQTDPCPKQINPCPAAKASAIHGVAMSPGMNWENIAKSLAAKCPDTPPLKVEMFGPLRPGWYNFRLTAPENCAGIIIPLPVDSAILVVVPQDP